MVEEQNKEVILMALECCADLILKMNDAVEGNMDLHAAMYFNQTFKPQFKLLEK